MDKLIFLESLPEIVYSGERIKLPAEVTGDVEEYWTERIASGKKFSRGDVFSIDSIERGGETIRIGLSLSDYAHYLATINGKIAKDHACRVVHSSVMIEMTDGQLAFGQMSGNTALPGRVQCVGGGITRKDLADDGEHIDIRKNAATEMLEEIGIAADDAGKVRSFRPWAMVESGPYGFLGLVFWAMLSVDKKEFARHYAGFETSLRAKGESPELSRIVFLDKDEKDKLKWLSELGGRHAEYLPLILGNIG